MKAKPVEIIPGTPFATKIDCIGFQTRSRPPTSAIPSILTSMTYESVKLGFGIPTLLYGFRAFEFGQNVEVCI